MYVMYVCMYHACACTVAVSPSNGQARGGPVDVGRDAVKLAVQLRSMHIEHAVAVPPGPPLVPPASLSAAGVRTQALIVLHVPMLKSGQRVFPSRGAAAVVPGFIFSGLLGENGGSCWPCLCFLGSWTAGCC